MEQLRQAPADDKAGDEGSPEDLLTHAYHHPIHRTKASPMNAPTKAASTLKPMRTHIRAHSLSVICYASLL